MLSSGNGLSLNGKDDDVVFWKTAEVQLNPVGAKAGSYIFDTGKIGSK